MDDMHLGDEFTAGCSESGVPLLRAETVFAVKEGRCERKYMGSSNHVLLAKCHESRKSKDLKPARSQTNRKEKLESVLVFAIAAVKMRTDGLRKVYLR
jgi:hypothetical protein